MIRKIKTSGADITEEVAEKIGSRLKGREVIELISDLGGGKTTFVRGLAKGAGSKDHVSSPSFAISKTYQTDGFTLQHYDFYRLNEAGIMAHELSDIAKDDNKVAVIEWGDIVRDVLPHDRMTVTINNLGDELRELVFELPEELSYLMEDIG